MNMNRYFLGLLFLLFACYTEAQTLDAVISRWDDEMTEWDIYTLEGEEKVVERNGEEFIEVEASGQLVMRWQQNRNWTEWDFTVDDLIGSMKQSWKDDPTQWELRIGTEVVTCRAAWRDDLSEWRITNNKKTLVWRSKYRQNLSEWQLRDDRYGGFYVFTTYQNNLGQWTIVDELDESIPFSMKMAMTFLSIYQNIPKVN